MNTMTYQGYNARIEYDDEDEIFVGRLAGIRDGVGFHGETVEELKAAFHEAVDDYIEACAKAGKAPQKPFSGQLMVRIDPEVHARAAEAAELTGQSLAKWAENALLSEVLVTKGMTSLSPTATASGRENVTFKPVTDTLAKFQEQVAAVEKARAEETGGLKAQIAALMQASVDTQAEARKLSAALRRGAGVQGRWGEQTLRNVLEAAGLTKRFDFEEQYSVEGAEGRRRPDVVVRMPGGGIFVIDAKCSLYAFLDAQDALDDTARDACLARHAQSVRTHMSGLSSRAYWDQFPKEGSPDFVAMFVPSDQFLAAALEVLPELMSEAMEKRVLLVTPTTLFALCKAIAYGWRVEEQAANADQIATLGRELYKRLALMGGQIQAANDRASRIGLSEHSAPSSGVFVEAGKQPSKHRADRHKA